MIRRPCPLLLVWLLWGCSGPGPGLPAGFHVEPAQVDTGQISVGETRTVPLSIINDGESAFSLNPLRLLTDSPDIGLSGDGGQEHWGDGELAFGEEWLAVGGRKEIELLFRPQSQGSLTATLRVEADDANDPDSQHVVEVPINSRSEWLPIPSLLLEPSTLDFGAVNVGASPSLDLLIHNQGHADLHLSSLALLNNTSFTIAPPIPDAAIIAPAESLQVTVHFSPQSLGSFSAELSISSDDPDFPQVSVPLLGVGQNPDGAQVYCWLQPNSNATLQQGNTYVSWAGTEITADASSSSSPDHPGASLSANWNLSVPVGSLSTLNGSNSMLVGFLPDVAGTYQLDLQIVDSLGAVSFICSAEFIVAADTGLLVTTWWTFGGEDMDLHLVWNNAPLNDPSGDCNYSNCGGCANGGPWCPDWGMPGDSSDDPMFLQDDLSGTGPEEAWISSPAAGSYTIYVRDYPGSVQSAPNPTTVRLTLAGMEIANVVSTDDTATTDFGAAEGEYWKVLTLELPSEVVTVHNQILTNP